MILRTNQPDFTGGGNPEKAGRCVPFIVSADYDPWFGVGESEDEAIKVCNGDYVGTPCPKRHECLIFSLINNEAHGVWGGMYADDRTTLRRFTDKEKWEWHPPTPREASPSVKPDAPPQPDA